jgi:parvulin-like peptidyl-prolyl isomerase
MEGMKWCLMALILGAAASLPAQQTQPAEAEVIEEIIAKVNGDIVTRGDLEKARTGLRDALRQQGLQGADLEKALAESAANSLRDEIDNLLLIQEAKDNNINVDSDLSRQLADIQRQVNIADAEEFASYVEKQTGSSFEDFREEMRGRMLAQRVTQQEVGRQIVIPRDELLAYYDAHNDEFIREDRVFLRELLVSTEGKDPAGVAAAETKAKDLVARTRNGERFTDLVRDNSDSASKPAEGDIGSFNKGDLAEEIEKTVWGKERNYVTDPIRRPNGFLILRVEQTHNAGLATFEEVENEIMGRLFEPRFAPKVREYLTQLRQDAFLEIKEGWADTAAAPGRSTAWADPAQLTPETTTVEQVVASARRKRLFWLAPIPGTKVGSSSVSK